MAVAPFFLSVGKLNFHPVGLWNLKMVLGSGCSARCATLLVPLSSHPLDQAGGDGKGRKQQSCCKL